MIVAIVIMVIMIVTNVITVIVIIFLVVIVIVGPHQVGDTTPLELGRLPVTFSHADSDQAEWKKWFQQQNCRMGKCLRHLLCAKTRNTNTNSQVSKSNFWKH